MNKLTPEKVRNFLLVGGVMFNILQVVSVYWQYRNFWLVLGPINSAAIFYFLGYIKGNAPYQRFLNFLYEGMKRAQKERQEHDQSKEVKGE